MFLFKTRDWNNVDRKIGENSTGKQITIAIYPLHKNIVAKFSLITNTCPWRGRFYGNFYVIRSRKLWRVVYATGTQFE